MITCDCEEILRMRKVYFEDQSKVSVSRSVVSDSLRPHGLYPVMLLCLWDSPGKNTGVGCHSLLQGIFSQPRDWTWVSHIAGRFFTIWAAREAQRLILKSKKIFKCAWNHFQETFILVLNIQNVFLAFCVVYHTFSL